MRNAIFISYRRNDCQGMAGRIYDHLLKHFSQDTLFFDVDNIAPGENFETGVVKAVEQCHTMLVIIGPNWLREITTTHTSGKKDWVELEISTALNQNLKIIPLLLEDTRMPSQTELPESLQPLSLRNALSVRHLSFSANMQTLVSALKEPAVAKKQKERPAGNIINKKLLFIAAGLIIAAALFFIGSLLFKKKSEKASIEDFLTNELNKPDMKQIGAWDGISGALEIPKTKKLFYQIPFSDNDSYDRKIERRLNDLSYKGLITIKITRDEVFEKIAAKDLEISLTERGKKYLIGETMDKYYLNAFDYDKLKLISKKEAGDTIYIEFSGGGITNNTPVYDALTDEDKQKIDKDMALVVKGKLLRTKDGYKIIQGDSENDLSTPKENLTDTIQTPDDNTPPATADAAKTYSKYVLEGQATNTTTNKTASIKMEVTHIGNDLYKCTGSFDNLTLFGKFELTGKRIGADNSPETITLPLKGPILFGGDDGSNYPAGTTTTFTLTLVIYSDKVTGNYIVNEIPNSSWDKRKQNGLVTLKIKSRS